MIAFQFVANLVIAEALQIRLEPQQQTVGLIKYSSYLSSYPSHNIDG